MSAQFLRELFDPYSTENGLLCEIRCLPPARSENVPPVARFFGLTHLERAAGFAQEMRVSHDVYMGVLPRFQKASVGKAGEDRHVDQAAWLWCDIDRGDAGEDAVVDFLKNVRGRLPRPRMIVFSGSGGVHLYFRLAEPASLASEDARDAFAAILRRLVAKIGQQDTIHADRACCNLSRILRLPSTFNHKHDPLPKVYGAICPEYDALTLSEWDNMLPFDPQPKSRIISAKVKLTKATSARLGGGYLDPIPPGMRKWAEAGYPEGNRHHDLVGAAAWLQRDTDLPSDVAYTVFVTKAQNSPGRRPITDAELEKAWNWAGRQ